MYTKLYKGEFFKGILSLGDQTIGQNDIVVSFSACSAAAQEAFKGCGGVPSEPPQPAGDTPWSGLLIRRRCKKGESVEPPYLVHCFSTNLLIHLSGNILRLSNQINLTSNIFHCFFSVC